MVKWFVHHIIGTGYLPAVTWKITSPSWFRYLFSAVTVLEEYLSDTIIPFLASDHPLDRNLDLSAIITILLTWVNLQWWHTESDQNLPSTQ